MFKQPTTALITTIDEFGNPLEPIQAAYCTIVEYQESAPGMATIRFTYWDANDNNLGNDMWFSTPILSNMTLLFRRAVAGTITDSQRNVLDENLFLSQAALGSIAR